MVRLDKSLICFLLAFVGLCASSGLYAVNYRYPNDAGETLWAGEDIGAADNLQFNTPPSSTTLTGAAFAFSVANTSAGITYEATAGLAITQPNSTTILSNTGMTIGSATGQSWTQSGGTFTIGNGTVIARIIITSDAQFINNSTMTVLRDCTITINSTGVLDNNGSWGGSGSGVTINGAGTFRNDGTMAISGNRTISCIYVNNATFNVNAILTMLSPGTITNSSTGTITATNLIQGNAPLINNGTFSANTISDGPGGTPGSITNNGTMTLNSTYNRTSALINTGTLNCNASAATITFPATLDNSNILNIGTSSAIVFTAGYTNTGTINLNSSTITTLTGSLTGTGSATLNFGNTGTITYNKTNTISIPNIAVKNSSTVTLGGSVTASSTITVNSNCSLTFGGASSTIAGAGTLTNDGTLVWGTGGNGTTSAISVANNNIFNVNVSSTNNGTITNNATMTISAALINNGTFNIASSTANSSTITNNLNMTLTAALTGAGTVTNAAAGTLTFAANASNANTINNSGTFNVTGSSTNTGAITNNNDMTISAALAGAGTILNNAVNSLLLTDGAIVANAITNPGNLETSGNVTVNNTINNSGTMSVAGTLTMTDTLTNTGTLTIGGNISMAGESLDSTNGTVTVSGQRSLTVGTYTNADTQNHTITDASTFDSLTITGNANISNADINITSSYAGSNVTWTIISATALTHNNTTVNLPADPHWSSEFVGQELQVSFIMDLVEYSPPGSINYRIATVIDAMAANITNAQQQELVDIFFDLDTGEEVNAALQQMVPLENFSTQSISLQNSMFNRVERRIAALGKKHSLPIYSAGDVDYEHALWLAPFGTVTNQQQIEDNFGYIANVTGILLGYDQKDTPNDLFGVAIGISRGHINDRSNSGFKAKVVGYHALTYGGHTAANNDFYEWLFTGTINDNTGRRAILINGNDLSTASGFHNYLLGSRVNVGKHFDLSKQYRISPLGMLQYAYVEQPSYTETNSVAALQVSRNPSKNILTAGLGTRLSFYQNCSWIEGLQELRAMVSYDVVNTKDTITSSFVAGSTAFLLNSSPARWALKLGMDVGVHLLKHLRLQCILDYEVRHEFTNYSGMLKFKYVF